jgi:ketosteroid isomerase-like protein
LLSWSVVGSRVSASRDLAYTYGLGTIRRAGVNGSLRRMSYARIWRPDVDGQWKVVVEVILPHPATPESAGLAGSTP